jgi:hypothetical protein
VPSFSTGGHIRKVIRCGDFHSITRVFHFSPFLHPKAGSGFGVVFCFSPLRPDQKTGIIEKNRKPVRIFDLCRLRKKEKSLDIV